MCKAAYHEHFMTISFCFLPLSNVSLVPLGCSMTIRSFHLPKASRALTLDLLCGHRSVIVVISTNLRDFSNISDYNKIAHRISSSSP